MHRKRETLQDENTITTTVLTDDGASPVDGLVDEDSPCADNWVNLGGDNKKHKWDIFDESGVFVTVC